MKEKGILLVCAAFLTSCASQPAKVVVPKKSAPKTEWDYDRIRDARQAEEAQSPPTALLNRKDEAEDCLVMTRAQMIRSKASGCRPMDPREGGGEDSFCCPRD
jgi:hypothetical protein